MVTRELLFLLAFSCLTLLVRAQEATLVDHLDEAADKYGYSLVYSSASIPDTVFVYIFDDSASAKTCFGELTEPFGLTYNFLANQVILTATKKQLITFSGFVEDVNSGERLVGAAVYLQNSPRGTYTNGYGYFSLQNLDAKDTVTIKYLGYPAKRVSAKAALSGRTTVRLRPSYQLDLVEIFPVDEELSQLSNAGKSVPLGLIRKTEFIRGQPDLNAWLNLQPGVTSAPLGFGGYSIRGADPSQNLILLDDATLYLPSHLGGYMSVVPGEAIKSVQLYKNAGKARYGDRVGGVLDIRLRDGSNEKRKTNVNFGLSDLSFNTEGPIGKGSYFFSGRRGLTDFWLKALRPTIQPQQTNIPNIDYTFYDIAAKINYPLGPRQRIHASVFMAKDEYDEFDEATRFVGSSQNQFTDRSIRTWSNLVSSLRYNLTIGSRWFANTTLTASQFNYDALDVFAETQGINTPSTTFEFEDSFFGTRLRDLSLRQDVEFAWKEGLSLKLGADAVQHRFEVGTLREDTTGVGVVTERDYNQLKLPEVNTYDLSSYGYVDWQVSSKLGLNLGLRVSGQLGGEETFLAVLPRISFDYKYSKLLSFHGDGGISRQYIHQVSTLNPGLPRDLWVPSVNGLTPQENRYVSFGVNVESLKQQAFGVDIYASQVEGLSRFGNEVIGVSLDDWGNTIRRGSGYTYGAELRYTGNFSELQYDITYSFMVATRQFEDALGFFEREERFELDRRHFSAVSMRYPLKDNWGVGATWSIGSGLPSRIPFSNPGDPTPPPTSQPLTPPWTYGLEQIELPIFQSLDLGVNYTKSVKSYVYNLSFGVQNVYLHRNTLFLNLQLKENASNGENRDRITSVSAPPILPFLRYGITF